jgi:hypothetical protein
LYQLGIEINVRKMEKSRETGNTGHIDEKTTTKTHHSMHWTPLYVNKDT